MTYAIIGSRTANNSHYDALCTLLANLNVTKVISGGARGADKLGERYASENGIPIEVYLPDWSKYGTRAGLIRNTDIVSATDYVIALWDYSSRGTADSIRKARALGKKVLIININTN